MGSGLTLDKLVDTLRQITSDSGNPVLVCYSTIYDHAWFHISGTGQGGQWIITIGYPFTNSPLTRLTETSENYQSAITLIDWQEKIYATFMLELDAEHTAQFLLNIRHHLHGVDENQRIELVLEYN